MNEERFTGRADNYEKYRPSYPDSLIDFLYDRTYSDNVIDVGAGTGKFTRCLMKKPWKVTAVEPNTDMLKKLETINGLKIVKASAEDTGLESGSTGLVTAAQAFHWFDQEKFKIECRRLLKLGGKLAVIFNVRDCEECTIGAARNEICEKYSGSYHSSYVEKRKTMDGEIFRDNGYFSKYEIFSADNDIEMNEQAFIGDALSSSYALTEADEKYTDFLADLKATFDKHQKNGIVTVKFKTICTLGEF